jgi:hypothetical protein
MRFMQKARVGVVDPKEEMEARLKTFIVKHLETVTAAGIAAGTTYRLLALSADSPVARVMSELAPECSAAGVQVQAVLARHARNDAIAWADCRFVNDLRLLDAHEQLVLDHATVWIGDCMRRDPLRRDAFQQFAERSTEAAGYAARSFAHIWLAAGPSGSLAMSRTWTGLRLPALFDPSLLAGVDPAAAAVILRH